MQSDHKNLPRAANRKIYRNEKEGQKTRKTGGRDPSLAVPMGLDSTQEREVGGGGDPEERGIRGPGQADH